MSKVAEVAAYLNNCTLSVASGCVPGTGLTSIYKCVFKHAKSVTKVEMVKELSEFYADDKNIVDIWNDLNDCERDFVTYIVQYGGIEYIPTTLEYAKKHNLKLEYKTSWGTRNILDSYECAYLKFLHLLDQHMPITKTVLLFPNGKDMPPFILAVLQTVIEPMKCEYKNFTPATTDYLICRENRLGDFAAIVRFTNTEQVKVKVGTFDTTKTKLIKMSETIGFEEVCDKNGKFCALREAKRSNDFKIAPLLFALAANSKLVDIDREGIVSPGKQSSSLLMLPPHELAKKLFDDYARDNAIYELYHVSHITVHGGYWWIKWHKCRKPIFELVKKCPIGTFVSFKEFNDFAKIFCGNFFKQLLNYAVTIKGSNFDYDQWEGYGPHWDECEAQIIRLILSFLSAIGMIDIAYTQNVPRIKHSDNDFCVGISGFRVTKLGAWILGMTDKYEAVTEVITQNTVGELIVLPDYSIVISGLKCRIEHETFLSRIFTQKSSDENAAIYKIDFKSIVRAYSCGITPMKIKKYLEKISSKPLPDNVERTLSDWQAKVGRVKIRELLVLETDDALLLEEIKHIKAMKDIIIDEIHHAIILTNDGKKKAKTLIEKNGWLVKT